MSRFVVLEHDCPRGLHWDFMLETQELLATWALPQPPDTAAQLSAQSLPDHRPLYLEYEGPLSQDRGSVIRWDQGTYEIRHRKMSEWVVLLMGTRLQGTATLTQRPQTPNSWSFLFQPHSADKAGRSS